MDYSKYIGSNYIKNNLTEKKVAIYGAGKGAEDFFNAFSCIINISHIIDGYKYSETFHNYKIISIDEVNLLKDEVIIIVSWKYRSEIEEVLLKHGYIAGNSYFIWDSNSVIINNEITEKMIKWNYKRWPKEEYGGLNRILLPFENVHDVSNTMYAYVGNYLRKKYHADMECYMRHEVSEVYPGVFEVYKSFGVKNVVNQKLSPILEKKAKDLSYEIWEELFSYEDWKNIIIYGINFGTTIIRSFLRFHIPFEDIRDERYYDYLYECIKTIVFWYDRFEKYDYKTVVLWDGTDWEGFIRDIAITKGIPTYAVHYSAAAKPRLNWAACGEQIWNYKKFWYMLSDKEKEYGLNWSKEQLDIRLSGRMSKKNDYRGINDPFSSEIKNKVLEENDKIKVLICPHSFEDDSYMYGEQIFDNNYYSWLCHLGELSESLTKYDWYLKSHPSGSERDEIIISNFVAKYKNIKRIPALTSPWQLKNEGVRFALTVQGTIGHEYPLLGINVINAGINPHISFDFDLNPRTKWQYDDLIMNLDKINKTVNIEEIYQYYAIAYLYYDRDSRFGSKFFINDELNKDNWAFWVERSKKQIGTWKYGLFLDEITEEKHNFLCNRTKELFKTMDTWHEDYFYKKEVDIKNGD